MFITAYNILRYNFPLTTLVSLFIFTDTSSFAQRPSSPEREEESDTKETEPGRVIDLITTTSPSSEAAGDRVGLEVAAESPSDTSIPEVQGTSAEPSSSANILEEETSETAAPDS